MAKLTESSLFQIFQRASVIGLLLVLVPASIGCGDPPPPSGNLTGNVSFEGEAVGDCKVLLYSPTTKRSIGGKVDSEGNFKITEVPLGDFEVSVKQRVTNSPKEEPFDQRIPKRFRDSKTSGFKVSVVEGENEISLDMTK